MSRKTTSEWLHSHHSHFESLGKALTKKSRKIAVSSGKGGVGKTTVSLKLAKYFALKGEKTLLIDCDFNLSNTSVKLGIPLNNNFFDLISGQKTFDEVLYKEENFHLLSACNGHIGLFEGNYSFGHLIIDILSNHESEYQNIILDCPAGLTKDICLINTYCDERIVVITPDKSSITDSYSLIKVLNKQRQIKEGHLLFNKISSQTQYQRLVKTFLTTAEHYLDCRLSVLGSIPFLKEEIDQFDRELFNFADSKINKSFNKAFNNLSEKNIGAPINNFFHNFVQEKDLRRAEQEVPTSN